MQKASKLIDNFLNVIIATALSLIVILVFTNVVLRYIFSSGIIWSQELSRYLFVWLVFIGAIAAFKENQHLAVDMLVRKLPKKLKKISIVVSYLLMLMILVLILQGSWEMTILNLDSTSPATGLPLSVIYVMGIVMSISMGFILLINLFRLLTNKVSVDELIPRNESEELIELHQEDRD